VRGPRLLWLLAVPRLAGGAGAGADIAHSRHVLDIWLDTTAPSEPLHNIAGLDRRRRIVARRMCILAAHARENGRLAMRLRRRRPRSRRRGGRGRRSDGGSGESGLGRRLPRRHLPLPALDHATKRLNHNGECVPPLLLLLLSGIAG